MDAIQNPEDMHSIGVENDREYKINLGQTLKKSKPSGTKYHDLQYSCKPASCKREFEGAIQIKQRDLVLCHKIDKSGTKGTYIFSGKYEEAAKKELVLIFDPNTQEFRLECMNLRGKFIQNGVKAPVVCDGDDDDEEEDDDDDDDAEMNSSCEEDDDVDSEGDEALFGDDE